jgi:hypothetical protein
MVLNLSARLGQQASQFAPPRRPGTLLHRCRSGADTSQLSGLASWLLTLRPRPGTVSVIRPPCQTPPLASPPKRLTRSRAGPAPSRAGLDDVAWAREALPAAAAAHPAASRMEPALLQLHASRLTAEAAGWAAGGVTFLRAPASMSVTFHPALARYIFPSNHELLEQPPLERSLGSIPRRCTLRSCPLMSTLQCQACCYPPDAPH